MMTTAQFEAMIPCGGFLTLYHLLDEAMAERSAVRDDPGSFYHTAYDNARSAIHRLYSKLTRIAGEFLIDPGEVTLSALRAGTVRCYDLALLAQASGRTFLVPVPAMRQTNAAFVIRHNDWPHLPGNAVETTCAVPHLLPRLHGEYFRQAAQMMTHLRYLALDTQGEVITIPAPAAGNSVSFVYCVFSDNSDWEQATRFRFVKLWDRYLSPGTYDLAHFGYSRDEEMPEIWLAGYVDLFNNLQFFTS